MEEPEEKRIRIELPLEVDIYEESYEQKYEQKYEQTYEDPLGSNVCLTYDILRIVFRYLNGRDLSSVAMVCRSWLEAANNEKCLRGPYCFIEHYKPVDICASHEKRLAQSLDYIKESTIKPSIGFFFLSLETPHDIKSRICELLPKNCEAIMLFTHSIILNNNEMEHPYPNMVCALLPQIPNVKISVVKVTDRALGGDKYTEYMQMIEEASRQDDESTCLMLFCNRYGHSMGSYMASLARLSNDERIISLWGGVVEEMQYVHINNERFIEEESNVAKPYCVALLLTGSIQTWSIVVNRKCKTKEQVEEKLKLFKQQVKLQKHSVGFMFACVARGKYMYHEENVESTIFKRLFPEVPLVGCFGNGEFGKDSTVYNPELSVLQYRKKFKNVSKNLYPLCQRNYSTRRHKSPWHNEFSTMFMILTYG
ncbi:F-box only protein 22-like [Linepithema humile]|uniref:F-box only protein 22-like n=1 Tax=Linepithema humile TaxID=83485 RepID=UPI0006239238|nr:PREDICTED: F-box only protein 22-like [Linepithema humile]